MPKTACSEPTGLLSNVGDACKAIVKRRRARKRRWETRIEDGTPSAYYEVRRVRECGEPEFVSIVFAGAARITERRWPRRLLRERPPCGVERVRVGRRYEVRWAQGPRSFGWFRAKCVALDGKEATFRWSKRYTGYGNSAVPLSRLCDWVREIAL